MPHDSTSTDPAPTFHPRGAETQETTRPSADWSSALPVGLGLLLLTLALAASWTTLLPSSTPYARPSTNSSEPPRDLAHRDLLLPVEGVTAEDLDDSFTDARSGGRTHEALDIMAARGTPVLAVEDGSITRLHVGERGGIAVYQLGPEQRYIYYYAHLNGYSPGLEAGQSVARGQVLGYVGSTGNAPDDAPHLHFAIYRIDHADRWWDGDPVNPFPLWAGP